MHSPEIIQFTIERVHYSQSTGQKLSKPKTMELESNVYEKFAKIAPTLGLTIKKK